MRNDTAVLVKRVDSGEDASLDEIRDLARAAGYDIVGEVTQSRQQDSAYEIGRGKVGELRALVERVDASKVVFDNELGPYQVYNLGNEIGVEVDDRFTLILEIFGDRAGSRKAQLQVELAELKYELPRADAKANLANRDERPGFMGLGEYDEKRKSDMEDRISRIRDELGSLSERDEAWRRERRRSGFELVALAGYTNAGKSTLMRSLADVDEASNHPDIDDTAESRNELFTTLGTTTRRMDVPGRNVLLSDTVGFISDLPHWLVQSFESTLDEVYLADLVLLVVDASDPVEEMREKLVTCHDTLWERVEAPVVTVLNKADLLDEDELAKRVEAVRYLAPDPVVVSAVEGDSLDELVGRVKDELPDWERETVELPMSDDGMSTVSWLYDTAEVLDVEYGERIRVEFKARDEIIAKARNRSPLETETVAAR
ncbi:GTPase HflX [Haladaptatus sp. F3-133]|jgi:GTP-binding protein HflX|uniref:GTPase HflX n=1 Tax=Halorutilus salinus TaxID=2487751 RepID=A0A9Q4C3N3_9EURY|nr:GTPase HflX [Halorutilus salinus]MCX2818507.1 GTPase HflX [Halorutilus salinus]